MDYSRLSDFEINKLVAREFGLFGDGVDQTVLGYHSYGVFITYAQAPYCGYGDREMHAIEVKVDYCNNSVNAMPIIIENGISIAFDKNEDEWVAWGDFSFDLAGWDMKQQPAEYQHDKNPLRAAMIVFLMMQDAKHG
ncbi:DUF2591 domain-containing protein [Escherichia coli]|uniref:phage protein NinX family protein n=1 Tax=Escherichia coli TaxID=562 RepID=UPI001F05D023|nr:phage protein NinX family protein [Escherichia coli]MCH0685607.1 DUF2591 domain-containing protein [Escherichia coli]MDZ8667107.1 phage protein NinX family protein [Escherichia coli]WRX87689.1 phage protein NinX family protein [Escherichia coli]